jgi:hypothetical protein
MVPKWIVSKLYSSVDLGCVDPLLRIDLRTHNAAMTLALQIEVVVEGIDTASTPCNRIWREAR